MRSIALVFVALLLGLVGCRGQSAPAPDLQVALVVAPTPYAVGPATVSVSLADARGAAITGATVEVEGNMSHAGMVPVVARAAEAGEGRYVTDGFRFTMGGDWILTVRATLPDGTKAERSFDVKAVAGDGHAQRDAQMNDAGHAPGR